MGEGDEASSLTGDALDRQALRGLVALSWVMELFAGQAERTSALCEEALALLPEEWNYGRGNAELFWGWSMRATGRGDAAHRRLLDKYESLPWKTNSYAVRLLFAAAFNAFETRPT